MRFRIKTNTTGVWIDKQDKIGFIENDKCIFTIPKNAFSLYVTPVSHDKEDIHDMNMILNEMSKNAKTFDERHFNELWYEFSRLVNDRFFFYMVIIPNANDGRVTYAALYPK